jgi:hypothetical protein
VANGLKHLESSEQGDPDEHRDAGV